MGRAPCCSKDQGLNRGPWTAREDTLLIQYIQSHGEGHWRSLPKKAGLLRCGKSCRLRWLNYLRPDIKRGNITPDEEDLIVRLHSLLGNRWSLIAGRLPGRTDNEIKNYWNTHIRKRLSNNSANKKEESKCVRQERHKNDGGCVEKIKVHVPKAIRVSTSSSITRNIDNNLAQLRHYDSEVYNDLHNLSCSDENHEIKNDHSRFGEALVCDNEKEFDDFIQGNGACSEMIYKEYGQLLLKVDQDLQLDSFIDSLLI